MKRHFKNLFSKGRKELSKEGELDYSVVKGQRETRIGGLNGEVGERAEQRKGCGEGRFTQALEKPCETYCCRSSLNIHTCKYTYT